MDFKEMASEEVLKALATDATYGLASEEAENRIRKDGYNEVIAKQKHPVLAFLKKFWNLNAWLLEFIIITSFILHNYNDCYIVLALLLLNAVLGFIQEHQAAKAMEVLKNKLQVNARVLRDAKWAMIPSRELVCGDIVRVRNGDFVPADIKILTGAAWVNQAALTGESIEIEKKENDIIYSGSTVTRAELTGVVVLTGPRTYFGRTIELIQIAKPKLHIERAISDIIRSLLLIITVMLVIALVFLFFKEMNILQALPLLLVLFLTAIPIVLPTMFAVTLALGSKKLVKKSVLITRLNALDDAASMDILCVDKTGTLTMNKLSIVRIAPLNSFRAEDVLLFGALASEEANRDPTDMAFITAAEKSQLLPGRFSRKKFIPFDPNIRRTEAYLQDVNEEIIVMKGAFNIISSFCEITGPEVKQLDAMVADFAAKGYKTIAVSVTKNGKSSIVGLVALQDIPHPDARTAIKELDDLGVAVKMLTGDSLAIAKEIARQAGLGNNIIKIADFKKMVEEAPKKAAAIAEQADGFAEIYPEDKYLS